MASKIERGDPEVRFRKQIDAAVADSATLESMTLRLTLRDVSLLSRNPAIPLTDISYVGGEMRFLGVRVEKGGVPESRLDRGAD
ncbi:MAG: hypothetical protein DI570_06030 [Phenylobacterium zucineum]|nr:MAG: hypothetical protein DI570_06030 [Phenylobacterium zucineum]